MIPATSTTPQPYEALRRDATAATENALVARLRSGDELAFEDLVRTYGGRLLSIARRILSSPEDAKDVVQETFLAAFQSLDRFRGEAKLSTWLSRIAVNHCLMRLRTRRRKPEQQLDELLPKFVPDGHQARPSVRWDVSVDSEVERRELFTLVRRAIDELPENYRTVLLLRDIEELTTEEAAGMLGITTNTVKVRLHRARQALRTLLEPHFRPV